MGYLVMNMREDDAMRFESALKKAKSGIHEACDIFEDMKEQFGERRGSYGERGGYSERYDGRYSSRGGEYGERDFRPTPDWELRRDSRGRYM